MKKQIQNFLRYRFLLGELVKKGIKLKYRRSYLGILWSLLEPLATMIVLTIVFGTLFQKNDPTFPVYILSGRLLYTFFSTSTKACLKSIRNNAAMIKKVYVPKYLYPLSTVLFNYVISLLSIVLLFAVSLILGVYPSIYWLQLIIPLILILVVSFGVGMILATYGVFFRDLEYIWSVGTMLIMYTCAIFYTPERLIKSGYYWILSYNPIYAIIKNFRLALYGQAMELSSLLFATVFAFGTVAIGLFIFHRKQDDFILNI